MSRHVSGEISIFPSTLSGRDSVIQWVRRWSIGPQPEASVKKQHFTENFEKQIIWCKIWLRSRVQRVLFLYFYFQFHLRTFMCLEFEYQVYVSNTFCFQNCVSIFASNNVASLVSLSISLSDTLLNPHNRGFEGPFSNNRRGLYLSEIFWRHSLDVVTPFPNNFEFLVCLSVC